MDENHSSGNGKTVSENSDRSPLSCRVSTTVKEQLTHQAQALGIPLSELVETILQRGLNVSDAGTQKAELSDTSLDAISDVIANQLEELKKSFSGNMEEQPLSASTNPDAELLAFTPEQAKMLKGINDYRKRKGWKPVPFKELLFKAFRGSFGLMHTHLFQCATEYGYSLEQIEQVFNLKQK